MNFLAAGAVQALLAVVLAPVVADLYARFIGGQVGEVLGGGAEAFAMGDPVSRWLAVVVVVGWFLMVEAWSYGKVLRVLEAESC